MVILLDLYCVSRYMLFAKCVPEYGEILGNPTATNVDAPVRDDATTLLRAPPGVLL